jgi:hypothetical protein
MAASFSAIVSLILNFTATETVGLATQTTACEWLAESAIESADAAVSAAVQVDAGSPETVSLPAGTIVALALKNSGGNSCTVSLGAAMLVPLAAGASFAVMGPIPSGSITVTSAGGTTVEMVALTEA